VSRELVLVHGRKQQRKDAAALKREWIEAWEVGLRKTGLSVPIPESKIRFPYYGETLIALSARRASVPAVLQRGDSSSAFSPIDQFSLMALEEVRRARAIGDDMVRAELASSVIDRGSLGEWKGALVRALDKATPAGGVFVERLTKDVYRYLSSPGVRDAIDRGVRGAFSRDGDCVVVGHSLGSVVAYSLLARDGEQNGWTVPLFVTLGSPLALRVIREMMAPMSHPECVGSWFNARDTRDVVALHPLAPPHLRIVPAVENRSDVRNSTRNHHGIRGYLGDPVVAARIHAALMA
jgi:hypothetical protein